MNQLVHWVLTVRASSCQGLVWIWFPTLNYFQQSLQTPLPQVARGVVKHVGVMNGIRPCTEMPRDAEPHAFSRASVRRWNSACWICIQTASRLSSQVV